MKTNHSKTEITLHFVFVTKFRQKFAYLQECFELLDKFDVEVLEANCGELNHVHILLDIHPSLCISKFVNLFKSESSKLFNRKFGLKWPGWQTGYFCCSVGSQVIQRLRDYIDSQ